MLLTEYDEKKTMRLFWRDAREEGIAQGREEGREEGLKEGQSRVIAAMLKNGIPSDQISEMTGLPFSEVERIRRKCGE